MNIRLNIILACLLATPAAAQQYIATNAGMINHAEGIFYLDQEQLKFPAARFREVAKGNSLRTGQGWVEVQLGPNAFLWIGAEGVLKMEDPSLTDMQLRIERGSVLVQIYEQTKANKLRINFGEAVIEPLQEGLYRLDSGKSQLSVYDGKAKIRLAGKKATVKDGKAAVLTGGLQVFKFDTKKTDKLYEDAALRSHVIFRAHQEARAKQKEWQRKTDQAYQPQQQQWPQEQPRQESYQYEQQRINNRPEGTQEGHPNPLVDDTGHAVPPKPQ